MAKRISKKVREEAALLCSMRASFIGCVDTPGIYTVDWIAIQFGISLAGSSLAWSAFDSIGFGFHGPWFQNERWAEAESLLRCGWSPK